MNLQCGLQLFVCLVLVNQILLLELHMLANLNIDNEIVLLTIVQKKEGYEQHEPPAVILSILRESPTPQKRLEGEP